MWLPYGPDDPRLEGIPEPQSVSGILVNSTSDASTVNTTYTTPQLYIRVSHDNSNLAFKSFVERRDDQGKDTFDMSTQLLTTGVSLLVNSIKLSMMT